MVVHDPHLVSSQGLGSNAKIGPCHRGFGEGIKEAPIRNLRREGEREEGDVLVGKCRCKGNLVRDLARGSGCGAQQYGSRDPMRRGLVCSSRYLGLQYEVTPLREWLRTRARCRVLCVRVPHVGAGVTATESCDEPNGSRVDAPTPLHNGWCSGRWQCQSCGHEVPSQFVRALQMRG
jgi:hypothetical protein